LAGCIVPDIEATYLAWIDCRELGYDNPATHLEKEAGIYLSDGNYFGAPGHVRFNYGCPHARVLEGLEKMASVLA
jgi:cystathionine beta-lyase